MTRTSPDHGSAQTVTDLRRRVEHLVEQTLIEHGGPAAVTRRPISSRIDIAVNRPADYLDAVTTARAVARIAQGLAGDYARRARGDGATWTQIAHALEFTAEDHDDPSITAFEWVVPGPSQRFDPITTAWDCASCGAWVGDRGPYGGHPADTEHGHAAGCTRHANDVRAYQSDADLD
jgi:hypothetical protein